LRLHIIIWFGDMWFIGSSSSILGTSTLVLLLANGEFDRGKPFVGQGRDEVLVVIVQLEAVEGE
jgi:hypothetical protein